MKAVGRTCGVIGISLCGLAMGAACAAEPRVLALRRAASVPFPGPAGTATVLYDQSAPPGAPGEYYVNADPAPDEAWASEGADDFEIGDAQGWAIAQFNFDVDFLTDGQPYSGSPHYNVHVYADAAGIPGDVSLCGGDDIPGTRLDPGSNSGIVTVPLPAACVLPPGRYWVGFSTVIVIPPNGMWAYNGAPADILNAAMWRNPGNAFTTGCTTWAPAQQCLGNLSGGNPAFRFQVLGSVGGADEIFKDGFDG